MPEARKPCVCLSWQKKIFPEIISGIRKFPLMLTSNVKSCMRPLPPAGHGWGDFCVTLGSLCFWSARERTYLHSGPAWVPSGVVGQEKRKCYLLVTFMTLNVTLLPKYRKTGDSQRFGHICFWSTMFLKIHINRIYKTNKMWPRRKEFYFVWNGSDELAQVVDLLPTQPAKLWEGVAIFTPGSKIKSPGLEYGSQVPFLCPILRGFFPPSGV